MKINFTLEDLVKELYFTPAEAVGVMLTIEDAIENRDDVMQALDDIITWSHGAESLYSYEANEAVCEYLNAGDTYNATIICVEGSLIISDWGTVYEEWEKEYCEVNGVIRCGYCGSFTDNNEHDWRDIVCDYCGRYVYNGEYPAEAS